MRLSGVDPSIIRELSGIYKPFVKAFKELISNAYDADAETITVSVARDFSSIEVRDNGIGLTPIEFHRDFARLGGSTAWQNQGRSPGGRPRIGYKGIGFLAVARYCSRMEVESATERRHVGTVLLRRGRKRAVDVVPSLEEVVSEDIMRPRIHVEAVNVPGPKRVQLKLSTDFAVRDGVIRLRSSRALGAPELEVRYSFSCDDLVFAAALDFDYLLSLERKADLRLLENFCEAQVRVSAKPQLRGTTIRLIGLKDFVVRDLAAPRRPGKVQNIQSQSGRDQFFWRLARVAPIEDTLPEGIPDLARLRDVEKASRLPRLYIRWCDEPTSELMRPVAIPKGSAPEDSIVPFEIKEGGLHAVGYILAQDEVLYPAELRGISVRVRNVAIGDPSFFGLERTLAGARKAALSQIGGEVTVLEGLDAADAINPGRESFYEENAHYRILQRSLIGTDEALGGAVARAIRLITDRGNVRGQVSDKLGSARVRRRVLTDISSAVNTNAHADHALSKRLSEFLKAPIVANGLANAKDVLLRPVGRLAGFEVEEATDIAEDFLIDFGRRRVAIDFTRDIWSHAIYLHGKYFEVSFKQGEPGQPMCEFDHSQDRIYVNWAHPVKAYMDDYGFLRSAIVWRLAYHIAGESAEAMINLALMMLAHRAE
jgi:Histidine kinase-, DNA gyrase B-, and HSP90-like ATPase